MKSKRYSLASFLLLGLLLSIAPSLKAQSAGDWQGAWQLNTADGSSHVLILSGDFFSWTVYGTADGAFGSTKGGKWMKEGKNIQLTYEFDTANPDQVGTTETIKMKLKKGLLALKGKGQPKGKWADLDQGKTTPLTGAWLISGRKRDGEIGRIDTDRPRKTMKILSGTRFQWIAYNTETKKFFGTGGGSYTAEEGKYIENIGFFSRDNSRVGASLSFNFAVEEGDWIHSGKSSKGDPLYEVWSKRQ